MSDMVSQPKKRMSEQDIAKGIGILIVVFAHSTQIKATTMNLIIAMTGYAMAFFFFMSGYNYKPGKGTWGKNVVKRCKQIIWPLIYYSVGVYGVMLIYFMIRQEATVKDALSSFCSFWLTRPLSQWVGLKVEMTNPFSGLLVQGWFLQHMITAYLIFYAVADYALKKYW
jgi:Fucose 4-O-acetylase and related acetyltransferases